MFKNLFPVLQRIWFQPLEVSARVWFIRLALEILTNVVAGSGILSGFWMGTGFGEPHKGFVGCFKSRWLGHISRTKSTFSGDEL